MKKDNIKPLRLSSTLIVTLNEGNKNRKILMVNRNAKISFGGSLVFPGGVCE